MDLETAQLVAFALWAESNEGVTGKGPDGLQGVFRTCQEAESIEWLRLGLGEDLAYKLENYLTVWAAAEEPEAPAPEKELQVITSEDVGSVEEALDVDKSIWPQPVRAVGKIGNIGKGDYDHLQDEPVEAPETPAEGPPEKKSFLQEAVAEDIKAEMEKREKRKKQRGKRK